MKLKRLSVLRVRATWTPARRQAGDKAREQTRMARAPAKGDSRRSAGWQGAERVVEGAVVHDLGWVGPQEGPEKQQQPEEEEVEPGPVEPGGAGVAALARGRREDHSAS
jgi:hypothetical protein